MTTRLRAFEWRHWSVILLLTVVAAALRFAWLGEWSLWVDEAHTWRDATMPLDGEYGFLSSERVLYPVTFVLLRFLFGVGALGFDEASLRLPFAIIGVLTIPVMALCGRRLIGPWPALLAAGLLALNPWHIFWSQNARGYVLVVLCAIVAIHQVHVWLVTERPRHLIFAMLSVGLGGTSHPTAAMLVFGFVGFLFARRMMHRGGGIRSIVRFGVVLLLVLAALPWLIRTYSPFEGFMNSKGDPSVMHFVETVAYYFRPTALLLALIGLLLAPRVVGRDRSLLLGTMVVLPFLALLVVGGQLVKVTARYAICTLPAITWLVAMLCANAWERLREREGMTRRARIAMAVVLPALVVGEYVRLDVAYFQAQQGQRAMWREASEFVQAEAKARGLVGINALTISHPTLLYYLRRRHWFVTDLEPHPNTFVQPIIHWMIAEGVNAQEQPTHDPGPEGYFDFHRRLAKRTNGLLAVMVTLPKLAEQDPGGELLALLRRDFQLALHLPCWVGPKDQSVYVYLPKSEGG